MGLAGFTVQSLPLQGQIVFAVQAAQFSSVAPLDPRPGVLKHIAVPAPVVNGAIVVDLVVSGVVSVIVEEACVDEDPAEVVAAVPVQSHA